MSSIMNERAANLLELMKAHRFWIEVVCTTAAALIMCILLGRGSHARADRLEVEAERLEKLVAAYGRWSREFRPSTRNEERDWTVSENEVRSLGIIEPRGIAVAQTISRAADQVGIDARV